MIRALNYIRRNKEKLLIFKICFWTVVFQLLILVVPSKYMKKYYGVSGEESAENESNENYIEARKIAFYLKKIAEHTPWECKCLVRALTAQKLLTQNKISSTLYLGLKKEGEKLMAHAWVRTGSLYAIGGYGDGFTIVAKFKK